MHPRRHEEKDEPRNYKMDPRRARRGFVAVIGPQIMILLVRIARLAYSLCSAKKEFGSSLPST
jgi:hypothetical protein